MAQKSTEREKKHIPPLEGGNLHNSKVLFPSTTYLRNSIEPEEETEAKDLALHHKDH